MTLPEYYDLLVKHDWYYGYADEAGKFREGEKQEMYLVGIAKRNGKSFMDLYDKFHDYIFADEHDPDRKPQRPQE